VRILAVIERCPNGPLALLREVPGVQYWLSKGGEEHTELFFIGRVAKVVEIGDRRDFCLARKSHYSPTVSQRLKLVILGGNKCERDCRSILARAVIFNKKRT
jgi:hypothetical protein